jgi:hypothetical protein
MFAPIPPVPVPRVPYALSPEQSNRLEELTRYMEAAALLRYRPLVSQCIHLM